MQLEDCRAHELRKASLVPKQSETAAALTATCSLAEVYELHNSLTRAISLAEDEVCDEFQLSLGPHHINLTVANCIFEFTDKATLSSGWTEDPLLSLIHI